MNASPPLLPRPANEPAGLTPPESQSYARVVDLVSDIERRTFRLDSLRSISVGVAESFGRTFFLLIALRGFSAPKGAKSIIASASGLGFLLSPVLVSIVMRRRVPAARAAALVVALGGLPLVLPLLVRNMNVFVVCAVLALAAGDGITVLVAPIHAANYPSSRRGALVSKSISVRVAASAIAGIVLGRLLKKDIGNWPIVLTIGVLAWITHAIVMYRMPSTPLVMQPTDVSATRRRLRLVRDDRILRNTLVSWMLMGFANLMTIPLRVEYLANPRYGVVANSERIALLTITIPAVVRLVLTPLFGWLFDRVNFFGMRIAANAAFGVSIATFFAGKSEAGLVIASIAFGVGVAAGDVLWSMWAVKFAPKDKVADYMALHTFSTGIRATVAPFVGFILIEQFSVTKIGFFCGALTMFGSFIVIPEWIRSRRTSPSFEGVRNNDAPILEPTLSSD
jgi:predicted MFS family arabinose efflux permease